MMVMKVYGSFARKQLKCNTFSIVVMPSYEFLEAILNISQQEKILSLLIQQYVNVMTVSFTVLF